MVAFAEVLDQLSGIEYYMGTAVGLHLQKFWISFAEVNVVMILERHFGRPEGVKVGPGTAFGTILWRQVGPGTAFGAALWRQVGLGTALWVALGHLKRPLGRPGDAKLALERRLAAPGTPENEVKSP